MWVQQSDAYVNLLVNWFFQVYAMWMLYKDSSWSKILLIICGLIPAVYTLTPFKKVKKIKSTFFFFIFLPISILVWMLINILLNLPFQHHKQTVLTDQSRSSVLLYVLDGVCILFLKLPFSLKKKLFIFINLNIFFSPFNPSSDLKFNDVVVYEIFQCPAKISFDHCVCRVAFFIDSLNFGDFFSFVGLPKAHYIDHQAFFYGAA